MLMHKILAALLWVLAAFGLFALCAMWFVDAQSGTVSAWVILPFFWSAAVLSVFGHHLALCREPFMRFFARHKPLAGSRASVELPS